MLIKFISPIVLLLMLSRANIQMLIMHFFAGILVSFFITKIDEKVAYNHEKVNLIEFIGIITISGILCYGLLNRFYNTWNPSTLVKEILSFVKIDPSISLYSISILACIVAFPSVKFLLQELLCGLKYFIERYSSIYFCILKKLKVLFVAITIIIAMIVIPWNMLSDYMQYKKTDEGKQDIYGNKSVMIIVPHQDDDLNIAAGIVEQYVSYGSEVYIVFVTNGDFYGLGETRIREAIKTYRLLNIPENHVIFLGYGDKWNKNGPHIYNARWDEEVVSAVGNKTTYGIDSHPAFNDGVLYTKRNLFFDMYNVIMKYEPQIILCSDYDQHIDHRATSLIFENIMGEILSREENYNPIVLKGYAYNAAWHAEKDYYSHNIRSTRNVFQAPYFQQPQVYTWENRIRLPIDEKIISRSLIHSDAYHTMAIYKSQKAKKVADRVVNGDKVFWLRRTDSILYDATIETSSGDESLLNDFMLLDSNDLLDKDRKPIDSVWRTEPNDNEKSIRVCLDTPRNIKRIDLYDNPSKEDNILNAKLSFDNGVIIETGQLNSNGDVTSIITNQNNIKSFTIILDKVEGADVGLTEIEAFERDNPAFPSYIKIMNEEEDFVYDYYIDDSGIERFELYTCNMPGLSIEHYDIKCNNQLCEVKIEDGQLVVYCPENENCIVTVVSKTDKSISDCVYIRNPNNIMRKITTVYQSIEEKWHNL